MNSKILIQFFLLIILILTSATYFYFYKKSKIVENNANKKNDSKISITEKTSNLIENITYVSTDNLGNKFEIKSSVGQIDIADLNIVYMTDVEATIYLVNSNPILIKSKYAEYNKNSYDTKFKENILITYSDHKISSENLDLSFKDNLATVYNKIAYNNNSIELYADILEIDLITKNSKIFMNNDYKKN